MDQSLRFLTAFFGLAALPASAAVLGEQEVRVSATLAQPGVHLASHVQVLDQPDGSRVLEVTLTNESGKSVNFLGAEVKFPWVIAPESYSRVAAGATATGRWPPTLVTDPAKDSGDPVSGMYLLAERKDGYSLAAFLSWRTFWSKLRCHDGVMTMSADGEGRLIRAGETVALEKVWLAKNANWQDLLYSYADAIHRELRLVPKAPRHFVGWSTWDYYGRAWRPDEAIGNLEALQRLVPKANLLQIDGGWWQERGDFMAARSDLGADGMKQLAADIRSRGFTAGLHFDGMRASERSQVALQHPEFFLHDNRGVLVRETQGAGGDGPYYFFDYSNPGACDYMRESLRHLRRDWGFEYFKIDYLRAGIGEDLREHVLGSDPSRSLAPFDRGLTSVERFRRAMAAFRAGMGEDAYFLGCSTPFGPTFGYVDGLRTSPDISPKFAAYRRDCEADGGNFYLNGKVVDVDSDYEVVRARADQDKSLTAEPGKDGGNLSFNEAEMWTDYAALFGSIKLASDDLMILRTERKGLVQFALTQPGCPRFVPLDYWQRARSGTDAYHVFLGESGSDVLLAVFNWSDAALTYRLHGIPPGSLQTFRGSAALGTADGDVQVGVAARHAVVFRLPAGTQFDRARKTIAIK